MEDVFEHLGVAVHYKLREAKQDRQHLVVVFAGVQSGEHDFYGFDGSALDNVKGAVLWIKDSFEGHNSYYMCAGMDFKIERAVSALIDSTLEAYGLTPADCTLLGGSKGGSAAMHLGLKYEYKNIVASAPQSRIGTYTRQKLKVAYAYMAGRHSDSSEALLNEYIPQLVASPSSLAKNIYIISSEADPEFEIHIRPLLDAFSRYENFNLLLTDSTLVTAHPEVTPYNIPFILGTIYALCEGLAPRFGFVRNGNGKRDRQDGERYFAGCPASGKPVAGFHWVQIKGATLNFRAYAAALGEAATEEPAVRPQLLAVSSDNRYDFGLDAMADKTLNSKLYQKYLCDYTWAGLKTDSDRGLSIESLSAGTFDILVCFASKSGSQIAPLTVKKNQKSTGIFGGYAYQLDASSGGTRVTKLSLDAPVPSDGLFDFTTLRTEGESIILHGLFEVPREEMREWNDGVYALTMRNESGDVSFPLAASRTRPSGSSSTTLDREAYKWANFSTTGQRGIDVASLKEGRYHCFVSFVRNGRCYTGAVRFSLTIRRGSVTLDDETSSIAV